ncbi:MAG: AAA family ATPase [Desulfobacterales bacterium]|nr:AAA family ATPase [Desulfobacterales bacterium]
MTTIPGYQIREEIYESSNSVIYRGIRKADSQPVVLKILNREYPKPEELTRFRREYVMTRDLQQDGIVRVFSMEDYNKSLVIIAEDFGGQSLTKLLSSEKMDIAQFLGIAIQVTDALGRVHYHNIIHKDINPSNIVWNPQTREARLIDFGISTELTREKQAILNPNVLEGTLAYMSPEQTGRMNRAMDYRTDLYSLGVTFYQILTRQLPFETVDPMEMVHSHIAKVPPAPHEVNSDIPMTLSHIILKLMAKTAEDRYQGAFGLKTDLQKCLDQLTSTGIIENFAIGRRDISDKFQIPQKLYGREQETETLLTAFDRVSRGTGEMVLVAGYSGVGKSSLVEEIHKPIVKQRGYFISGKFDQYRRNIPYASLVQAFRELIGYLLTETDDQIMNWRNKLSEAAGSTAQVIIDVIPELELIIGEQPPVPELDGVEAQRRFNDAFEKFLGVFCTKDHPLVLFLDDLQWADPASLNLIQTLMTGKKEQYLLILGAYRDNEVSSSHPLMLTLDEIQKKKAFSTIILKPLELSDTNRLTADTLQSTVEQSGTLSELIHHKTGGNPFFLSQLLTSIYENRLLNFDMSTRQWTWDTEKIQQMGISDNVVDLMVSKINKLLFSSQNLLILSSCLGNQFDLYTLSVISGLSFRDTVLGLWSAVQEGLIVPLDESYRYFQWSHEEEGSADPEAVIFRFSHDRIHEAAYSQLSEDRKKEIHLKTGRILLENITEENRDERISDLIFDLVSHLNMGSDLIASQKERDDLGRLNLIAGRKAKASGAYTAALAYLVQGTDLLSKDGWDRQHGIMYDLHRERIECEFLCGKIAKSEEIFKITSENAKTKYEVARIYQLMIRIYLNQYRYNEGLELGRECLRLFDIEIPDDPEQLQAAIGEEFRTVDEYTAGKEIFELVNAPPMQDQDAIACCGLLHEMWVCAFMQDHPQTPLTVLKIVTLSLKYGQSELSAIGYVIYGVIVSSQGDYDKAYALGTLAMKLKEKYFNTLFAPKVQNTFCNFINHYKNHVKTNIPLYEESYRYCLQSGEIWWGAWAVSFVRLAKLIKGDPLEQVYEVGRKYSDYIVRAEFEPLVQVMHAEMHIITNLMGKTGTLDSDAFDEEKMETFQQSIGFRVGLFWYYVYKSFLLFLHEENELALETSMKSEEQRIYVPGLMMYPDHYFFNALIIAANYNSLPGEDKKTCLETLDNDVKQMKILESHCPENFRHRYLLMSAEQARISGNDVQAVELYGQAIELAHENEFLHHEAIANELAGKFYLSRDKEKAARGYLTEAWYLYTQWGASVKVADMEEKYSRLLLKTTERTGAAHTVTTTRIAATTETGSTSLDLTSVMKASRAVSGEIVLDNLLKKLMRLLIENAGAQKGFLILEQDAQLFIKAKGVVDKDDDDDDVTELLSIPIETAYEGQPLLSVSVVNYTVRTKEYVVLNNAFHEGKFTKDPYIMENRPKSVLCMPIIHQGKLSCILYLENNLTSGAFTPDRLEVLQLISSEAAISVENARLYSRLKESEKKYRQIFDNAIEGIFQASDRGRLISANKSMARIMGYDTPDELLSSDTDIWKQCIASSEDAVRFHRTLRKKGRVIDFESQGLRRDGSVSWASISVQAIYDDQGKVLFFEGSLVDIGERKRKEKAEREREITEAINKEIMDSIRYAKMIQSSILPNQYQVKSFLPDSFFLWMPKDIVGGDFYIADFFEQGFIIAVIDCTGHGVPGAFMTMIASTGLRRIIKDESCHDPGEILKRLNVIIKKTLKQDTDYAFSDDGLDAAICFVNPKENTLIFAGAKLPLIYFHNNSLNFIKGDRQNIGYKRSDIDFKFTNHTVSIEKGMSFYMFSDGYIDQISDEKGPGGAWRQRRFGSKRLKNLLSDICMKPFEEQKDILIQAFDDFKKENERLDDVTVVGFGL